MHRRHLDTLAKVFAGAPAMRWADSEALLKVLGGVKEREGSRIVAMVNGVSAVFHRPHPSPNAKRFLIRDVKQFLVRAGVRPSDHG